MSTIRKSDKSNDKKMIMRQLKLLLIAILAVIGAACERSHDNPSPQPIETIAATYESIAGVWELKAWDNDTLSLDTYLYIKFDGESRRFDMWDNLGSMYVQHRGGTFAINEIEGLYIISGVYDNGVGDWAKEYEVIMPKDGNTMTWQSKEESMEFCRINNIPEFN